MNQETFAPTTVFQSRYEILSLLRETSLAATYKGRQLATGQPIVLKVVRLAEDRGSADITRRCRARFLRNVRQCARLRHPNIVRLIDSGETEDRQLYVAFEFVPGRSLAELLSEQGALDPQEARDLMLQVLGALDYAHQQGIVHGDLRPAHVMIVPSGARRKALVCDFGFGAVVADLRAGQQGARGSGVDLVGSQVYLAPEQRRGFPPTARSDLYTWGLVALECFTGRRVGCEVSSNGGALQAESREPTGMPAALLGHPLGALLRRVTVEDVAARAVTADGLLRELDACEVSGLRREDLLKPGAPVSVEAKGREAAGHARTTSSGGAHAERDPGSAQTLPQPSSEEPAWSLSLATTPARPVSSERAPRKARAVRARDELLGDDMPVRVGGTIKHYEIIRKLGQGGMGVVFLARDTKLGRLVAIKLLLRYSGQGIERFLEEARATARCRHESIVVIYEVDEIDGYPYLVLEYIKGRSLRSWMATREHPSAPESPAAHPPSDPTSPSVVIVLMIPVARALICAHEHGIVHRDLKPENVLLDDAGGTKVLDFGIAKRIEPTTAAAITGAPAAVAGGAGHGRQSAALGTPRYMSPEQLLGRDVDHRSDLWAMGIMLYELLTGRHPLEPFSIARLSEILALDVPMPSLGERRPDVGALGALVDRCLKKRKAERIGSARELLAGLEALLPGRRALQLGEDESPFAGLSSFQEADAARFFGRDREVSAMVTRLRNHPLLVVAGPSGAGKSSFVRAGLIPSWRRAGDRWEAFLLHPGRHPLSALADVLVHAAGLDSTASGATTGEPELPDHDRLVATLRAQPGYVGARLRARCRREGPRRRVLLFIDQFEELYTLGAPPDVRAAFIACLEGAADDASSPLRVVLAIRSDFLDRFADDNDFMINATRGLWLLPPMGRDGLREALTRPLEAAGYRFETAEMVEDMLGTLASTRSPLPLLQFTAAKLWEARDRERRLLTRDSYEQLGGIAGALSAHADAVLSALPLGEQRLARTVLLRLVTPERTRAVVSLDELCELAEGGEGQRGEAIARVIQHLAGARLLLIETGDEREGTTVTLVHESLIERWAKLRQWLAESERDAQFLARVRAAAQQWEASGEAEGLVWRGRAAEDARAWHKRRRAADGADARVGLGRREERYLSAVVALAERAQRLRRRLTLGVTAALGALALVVSYLAIDASQQARRADQAASRAQADALQARNATRMAAARELQADPTTVLALLREIEPPDVPRGWAVLARWALHSWVARTVLSHPDALHSAAFSPDGRRIVTASLDKTARVWNADGTGEPLVLRGHEEEVYSAAFSPDGKRIVTASWDKTARVWNADGTGEPLVLRGHEGRVYAAAFSPDGKRIVTASQDKTVRVWNADGTGKPLVLRGHEGPLNWAAFSPDGRRIVSASHDKTARVWNADGTGKPIVLRGHKHLVHSAAFSPDGRRIVTASLDKTARVWNADGTGEPIVLRGHEDGVYSAEFSPDGRRIVTAAWDKTARVWNADGKGEPRVLRGHEDTVSFAAFSPDGTRIVTASWDRTARVWNASGAGEPLVLWGHDDAVYSAAFSPDGRRIVTASYDKTVRVWNADGTGEPLIQRGKVPIYSAAFSPDSKRIVTASYDTIARVWSAEAAGEPLVFRGHEDWLKSAAFSPDGRRIVTASVDKTARVWNVDGKGKPLILRGHEGEVYSAAFSPDGKRIVTASQDKTVRVWNADGAGEPLILRGHDGPIYSAEFSPDGKRIVTASWDKTARVWNADGTGEPLVLRGHEHWVWSAAFSPDGKRIVTASQDKTVRLWNADGTGEPLVLRGSDSPVNSVAFSPDGERIVAASDDKLVRVWADLAPLRGVDDPKLWAATTYCMPVERRIELLRVPETMARANREACLRRVAQAWQRPEGLR
ncbi:nSTAND1 domain-containing NTPase [Sorangium sp. So ce131]|uniref:nSTAND1 domain-containing NTPase n=1 Tax=Sorangium sp. So ce131 TaxID=3133282 RepID=UPI003F63BE68